MGQTCNCVKDQANQPTVDLAPSGLAQEEHQLSAKNQEDPGERCESEVKPEEADEKVDIDLNDPDVQKAGLKIQSRYRGNKAREDVDSLKKEKEKEVEVKPHVEVEANVAETVKKEEEDRVEKETEKVAEVYIRSINLFLFVAHQ